MLLTSLSVTRFCSRSSRSLSLPPNPRFPAKLVTPSRRYIKAIAEDSRNMADGRKRVVPIDVVSDNICPWCYVGKSRLERAMSSFQQRPEGKDVEFQVNWHAFQLKPDLPQDDPGSSKRGMYASKWGIERSQAIINSMTNTFEEEGLPAYNMDGNTGSTFNSHRLVAWAGEEYGPVAQNKLIDALFKGYFTEARFPNDKEFLKDAADKAGLQKDAAAAVLDNPTAYSEQVRSDVKQAYTSGISGVPHFSIGSAKLSGAQDPALLERALMAATTAVK